MTCLRMIDASLMVCLLLCSMLITPSLAGKIASNSKRCTTSRLDEDAEFNEDTKSSKGDFGIQANHPSYMKHIWSTNTFVEKYADDRMLGHGIQVGPDHIVLHANTIFDYKSADGISYSETQSQFTYSPQRVHKTHGIPNHPRLTHVLEKVEGFLGNSPFQLAKIVKDRGQTPHDLSDHDRGHISRSMVEHNENEFGKGCFLHTYSRSQRRIRSDDGFRYSVRMAVDIEPSKCHGGRCTFSLDESQGDSTLCSRMDRGSPIFCGHDQKLTYLANWKDQGDGLCSSEIDAFHLPHLTMDMYNRMS